LNIKAIDDRTFLAQLNNQTLDEMYFDHKGHLRLAWLYLKDYEVDIAVNKTCTTIKAYAESLGVHQKFNMTITDSLVRIMAKRMEIMEEKNWPKFIHANTDLIEDALFMLLQYYTKDKLMSEEARLSVISPDIKKIS